ncbi:hypothetical protein RCIA37 [Methanocella arvoryzae MRE50]|uniref:Uncharacterized protein n=1 Tax=Methanocella arvoryzae (strain DSM 22066 / NBRC 105507 / MRE50) TaxID=351160 RepID=Q0W663_METAR|nr:hypothetical protein orf38 [uncultured archaeon]CAJ36130.1 hypothetical protein RCIA37 [Methanocella arvoryzae MRE50]
MPGADGSMPAAATDLSFTRLRPVINRNRSRPAPGQSLPGRGRIPPAPVRQPHSGPKNGIRCRVPGLTAEKPLRLYVITLTIT